MSYDAGFRIRTVSCFLDCLCESEAAWDAQITPAAEFLKEAQALFERNGEQVPLPAAAAPPLPLLVWPAWFSCLPVQHKALPLLPAGYEVQTVRIVTRALSAARSAREAAATAAMLERLCLARGITFLSLGATSDMRLLEQGCFNQIAACTSHSSCSFRYAPAAARNPAHARRLLVNTTAHMRCAVAAR
jgi:hypothetical protein